MAEEEVVILEATPSEENFAPMEEETTLEEAQASEEEVEKALQEKSKKKLKLFVGLGVFILLAIITTIVLLVVFKKKPPPPPIAPPVVEEVIPKPQFSPSKLETMIKKANLLYEQGNKEDALKIYERIATFNEAISHYNIGVAKMKEHNFSEALESFKKAIQNREHIAAP